MNEMLFKQSKEFSLLTEDGDFVLKNAEISVTIDQFIALIWDSCKDKSLEQIYHELNQENLVSRFLLERALYILVKAGLLETNIRASVSIKTIKKAKGPLVSVVVVNWNGIKHNEVCLNSILQQSYENLEVILVDNHSTDQSLEYVKENFPSVKIVALDDNYGVGRGLNEGMKAAKGKYIYLLNNDTELDKNAIALVVKVAEKFPNAAAVASKLKFFYLRNFLNSLGNYVGPKDWGSDCYIGYVDFGQFDRLSEMSSVCLAAGLVRRSFLKEIGYIDESFKMYYEDVDWCWRAQLLGYKVLVCPESVVYHKFGATSSTLGTSKLRYAITNRMKFSFRILQKPTLIKFVESYLKEDIKSCLHYIKKREFSYLNTYLRAYFNIIVSLPVLYKNRKSIQKKRIVSDEEILTLTPEANTLLPKGKPAITREVIRSVYYKYLMQPIKY